MKKTLLAITLMLALLATCLVGCNSVADNDIINNDPATENAAEENVTSEMEALKASAAAVFTLDVNPGIRVYVKADNTVIMVEATNEDGEEIVAELDIEGEDYEDVVEKIIDEMNEQGYIEGEEGSVLISVEKKELDISEKLNEKIEKTFEKHGKRASVIEQELDELDDEVGKKLKDKAEKYKISEGKARLIEKIREEFPELSEEELAKMNVNELQMDAENRIVKCLASNEDAEKILAGLSLEGVEMNTALTAIVGSMYVNGYLREDSNSILVSVDGKDETTTDTLLAAITSNINETFENSELDCSIIAQSVDVDDSLRQRAEENGVSVGKMRFVDKMVAGLEDYEIEDAPALAHMSIKDLNIIYNTRPQKGEENDPFGKDIASGHVGGVVEKDDALTAILASLDIDPSEVEDYEIKTSMSQDGPRPKTVYILLIKFKGDDTVYSFEVDCEDGGIVKTDERLPDNRPHSDGDTLPNAGGQDDKNGPKDNEDPNEGGATSP